MKRPAKLYKTTIEIWTDYNPVNQELTSLAHEATQGDGFCDRMEITEVTDPNQFPNTEFFGVETDEDEEG